MQAAFQNNAFQNNAFQVFIIGPIVGALVECTYFIANTGRMMGRGIRT